MNAHAEAALVDVPPATAAAELIERLNEPATVAALGELLDGVGTLSGLLTAAGSFLGRGEEIMDNVASGYRELGAVGNDAAVAGALQGAAKLAGQAAPLIGRVADSDIVPALGDPALLALLGSVLDAVRAAQAEVRAEPAAHEIGLVGMLRMTKDPEVRRGLGFIFAVMKRLGSALGPASNPERS